MSRILFLEDDQTLGPALTKTLQGDGYEVRWCHTASEALNYAQIEEFDAVISDCHLPDGSGVESIRKIKDLQGADTPVVLISGVYEGDHYIFESLKKTGALRFLRKPFSNNHLLEVLKEAFLEQPLDLGPSYTYFTAANPPAAEIIHAYKKQKLILGYELPTLIASFMNSSGYNTLELREDQKVALKLRFANGQLHEISTPLNEERDYLRVMAYELNWATSTEELTAETHLTSLSNESELNALSTMGRIPHHLVNEIIQWEALYRLSQFVDNKVYEVFAYKSSLQESNCWLSCHQTYEWLFQLITQKTPWFWVKSGLGGLANLKLHWRDHFHFKSEVRTLLSEQGSDLFLQGVSEGKSLNLIRQNVNCDERVSGMSIYFLMAIGAVWFDDFEISLEDRLLIQRSYKSQIGRSFVDEKANIFNAALERVSQETFDLLIQRKTQLAKEKFYQNIGTFIQSPLGPLFKLWFEIGAKPQEPLQRKRILEELELLKLEMKYDPIYYFVRAAYAKWVGRTREARNCLQTARNLGAEASAVDREMQYIKMHERASSGWESYRRAANQLKSLYFNKLKPFLAK